MTTTSTRPRRRRALVTILMTMLCTVAASGVSGAEDEADARREFNARPLTSKWRVAVGGNLSSFDTRTAWSLKGLGGTIIILEDTLGLHEEFATFSVEAAYRFNRRHSIELEATDFRRSALRIIDAEIDWGDYIFRANGEVATELYTTAVRATWKYDFSDSGRLNSGVLAGLSTYDIGITLEGEGRLEDDEGGEWVEGAVEGADVLAPVPVIGFYLDYALSPKSVLRFNLAAMDLDLGSKSGRILEADFSFEYWLSELVGLGFGIGSMDLEYSTDRGDERFGVDYRVTHTGIYLSFAW